MVLSFAQTTRLQATCDRKIASILAMLMHHGKDKAEELQQQQQHGVQQFEDFDKFSARWVVLVLPQFTRL